MIGFGVLAFSEVPVLSALGTTVAPGALLALWFAALLAPRALFAERDLAVQTLHMQADWPSGQRGCIVLLPGAQQPLEDFLAAGFDAAVRQRRVPLELILAAPALTHLTDRAWIAQLQRDIIEPRRAGGRALWLGGISLGAFMALRFAAEHPALVDGLCLLAPYLGSRIVAAEIARAIRSRDWRPGELSADDDERRVWCYVREPAAAARRTCSWA